MISAIVLYAILARTCGARLTRLTYDELDRFVEAAKSRYGSAGLSFLLAIGILALAMFNIRLDTACNHLGTGFALLASNPFDFITANGVGMRRLTPTVSYLIGLRGENIIVTNLLFALATIFVVAKYYVRHAKRPGDMILGTAVVCLSLVTFTTIHCGGYTDVTTYLLVFLMWWFRKNPVVFWLLLLVNLTNREAAFFLLPWFILLRWEVHRRFWPFVLDVVLGAGISLGVYYLYRDFLASQSRFHYSLSYYFGGFFDDPFSRFRQTFYYHGLGIFSVFKIMWILPVLAVHGLIAERRYRELLAIALIFAGSYVQIFIASDSSRLMTMAFMIMPLSLGFLWEQNRYKVRSWMGWVILANLAVPNVYTAQKIVEVWQSLPQHFIGLWLS